MKDEELWNHKAKLWHKRIGSEGDANRRYNSDPVLWRMIGDVTGLDVLDAGCGTAYLSIQLARRGARVRAVDYSDGMLDEARRNIDESGVAVDLQRDSCCTLSTVPDHCCDLVVSNYVLMDLDDLDGAIRNSARVLRPGGRMVAIFSHPCFDMHRPSEGKAYFDVWMDYESWGEFTTPFPYYHRPLSVYWKTFRANGFSVVDFDEPVVQPPYPAELDEETLSRWRERPFSIAYSLILQVTP